MIRTGTRNDLPQIIELVRRANDAPYELEPVLEEKLFAPGVTGSPELRVFEDGGSVRGLAVICGKYLRLIVVDRDHRRRGMGSALIGETRVIGAEPGNYFTPGIVDTDLATIAFAEARGFRETATTWNLIVDLDQTLPLTGRLKPAPTLTRVEHTDHTRFLAFVEQHFGRMWRTEATRAFEADPVTAFWIEGVGFAVHEANNRGLGTFGPTGVVPAHRGQGHGRILVLASLADLRRLGYSRVTIPWTDAIEFYRKSCGAEPAQRFVTFAK